MIHETFVASTPQNAYTQALKKYGEGITLVSAKQIQYEDGSLKCEVTIAIPEALFLQKSFTQPTLLREEEKADDEALQQELKALKQKLSEIESKEQIQTLRTEIKSRFVQKGILEKWVDKILLDIEQSSQMQEDEVFLVSSILEKIDTALVLKNEVLKEPKVMLFVGPTGVGKSTTVAKLAARYGYLMEETYSVGLLNLDSYKVGAYAQLQHYADIMKIEHIAVNNTEAFVEGLEQLKEHDIILVDTAGISPYDTEKLIETVTFMQTDIPRKIEVNLVLPATVKYEDMEDIYNNFSFLNLDGLIITKFDETRHLGTLLSFLLTHKLPMGYFSIGQTVPDDLLIASKEYLLERFVGDFDA